jgi:hypothetical protein
MLDINKITPKGKIYKYCSLNTCLKILKNGTLYFQNPQYFNDPFDCNISILKFSRTKEAERELRTAIEIKIYPTSIDKENEFREIWDDDIEFDKCWRKSIKMKIYSSGVSCFSERNNNTLMWSYYADQHYGMCLEFDSKFKLDEILIDKDITRRMFVRVDYSKKKKIDYNYNKYEGVYDLYAYKSEDWKHEQEVRLVVIELNWLKNEQKKLIANEEKSLIINKESRLILNKERLLEFNKNFITGLIFGCHMEDVQINEIIKLAKEKGYKLKFKKAIMDDFKLRFVEMFPTKQI